MAGDVPSPAPVDPAGPGAPPVRLALYRRYRPATFAELKGQDHVTEPLRQALRTGRINHAYLFSGPRGCGKTSSARILARSLNCEQGPTPDPCGVCASCVALAPSGPGSIDVIEIDAASHGGVDDARDLRERAFYAPVSGRFKIYIIDEAHMVTREGFNALLKLVEEPPPHLKFVFATTEPEKVIATIRSRTHHYPFRLIPPVVLRDLLEEILASEGVSYEPAVLPVVIRAGAGSARDSLSILDQLLAGSGDEGLTYERAITLLGYTDENLLDDVADAFAAGDGGAVFRAVDRVVEGGHDPRRFAADLLDRLRDLIILAAVPDAGDTGLLDIPADRLDRMRQQAASFGRAQLTRAAEVISAGLVEMRGATSPRLLLELMCAQVLLPGAGSGEQALLARLETLERRLAGGVGAAVARAAADAAPAAAGGQAAEASAAGPEAPSPAAAAKAAASRAAASGPAGKAAPPRPRGSESAGRDDRAAAAAAAAAAPERPAAQDRGRSPAGHPGAADQVDAGVLQSRWADVLEAVKAERKVAWILLEKATVAGLDDGVLTLSFANEGYARGFASSGYDADLSRVLKAMFGISPQIRGVSGPAAAAGATTRPRGAAAASPGGPSRPARSGDHGDASSYGYAPPDGPDDDDDPGGYSGPPRGGAPSAQSTGASAARKAARRGATGESGGSGAPGPSRGGSGSRSQPGSGSGSRPQAARDPDDLAAEESATGQDARPPASGPGTESLSGLDLIQRELGGKIIEEFGSD
jgi:DNA polymerase III subunit gamma/tau